MRQEIGTLLAAFAPQPEVTLLRVLAPGVAQAARPGQYVMVRVASGWDPLPREALLLAGIDSEAGAVMLWAPRGSPAREQLAALTTGASIDLLGPLGRPLPRRAEARQVLLVAEGLALGPLLALAEAVLAGSGQAALLAVVPQRSAAYPAEALPVALEYQRAPRGSASDAAGELLRWADTVYGAGSQRFYHDLRDEIQRARPGQRGGFAFGLLLEPFGWQPPAWGEARLACAVAACRACLVELRREKRLACVQGPTFDLWAL
ncbi:MAG: hypothetical protein M5U01_04505 [Ardenticatenaceae bacterium]|nr:hypothetical protein [Ardenticatenaceae bacterium]